MALFCVAEEVNFEHKSSNPEDYVFDSIVSTLEELLMDDKFQELQSEFGDRHCGELNTDLQSINSLKPKLYRHLRRIKGK
jgi:hypothetical protein